MQSRREKMCSISDCSASRGRAVAEAEEGEWLLELAANNDVRGLQAAVEEKGASVLNECGRWYCRQVSSNKMGLVERSPIMIAASFGSLEVLEYILAVHGHGHINKVCSADKSTVLQCAVASGASNTSQMVQLLLSHGANPSQQLVASSRTPAAFTPSSRDDSTLLAALDEIWGFQDIAAASSRSSPKYKTLQEQDAFSSDILKSGIYTTDEFRMYSFKVRPCSRAYSHDWTQCPFVHPGENARRRDPRRFHYSCVPCPDFRKGACRHGDACEYAHGVFESWLHPAQYRTRLCKDGMSCTRKVCFFAHTKEEVRPLFLSMECGGTSPRPLSPVDNPSGGAASDPSAALRLASFSPLVTDLGHSSFASSGKSLCDSTTWTQPSLPMLHLPDGAQTSRLSARGTPAVDGQLMRELASLYCAHARFKAAVAGSATPNSNNGQHIQNVGLNLSNVEDLSSASAVSPTSPLQMCLQQFSPRQEDDVVNAAAGSYNNNYPRRCCNDQDPAAPLRASPFQLQHYECGSAEAHQRSPLSAARASAWAWDRGCPTTGKKPEWGVSGHDLVHFRSSYSISPLKA